MHNDQNRCNVICHMHMSIDGKITGQHLGEAITQKIDIFLLCK